MSHIPLLTLFQLAQIRESHDAELTAANEAADAVNQKMEERIRRYKHTSPGHMIDLTAALESIAKRGP